MYIKRQTRVSVVPEKNQLSDEWLRRIRPSCSRHVFCVSKCYPLKARWRRTFWCVSPVLSPVLSAVLWVIIVGRMDMLINGRYTGNQWWRLPPGKVPINHFKRLPSEGQSWSFRQSWQKEAVPVSVSILIFMATKLKPRFSCRHQFYFFFFFFNVVRSMLVRSSCMTRHACMLL